METVEFSPRSLRFDSSVQEAFLNLWRTYDRLRALEDEVFSQVDLTPQQYNVLRLLKHRHPDTMPTLKLAERLVSRAPDISRIIDKLETRGLVTRTRSEKDRRTVQVGITAEGLALVEKLYEPLFACQTRQLGHMTPAELEQLVALLRVARAPHEDEDSAWR